MQTPMPIAPTLEYHGERLLAAMYAAQPLWVGGAISKYDSGFLAGLVHHTQARRIVEIGVASGWSSAAMLLAQDGQGHVTGIDLSPDYYLDSKHKTGAVVGAMVPDHTQHFTLIAGQCAFETPWPLGNFDFAFIDGNHRHPWTVLDLISLLPKLERGAWVALHDVNLCRKPAQDHGNRGPFYLYHMWPGPRLHSTQDPTMIGAILLEADPVSYLPFLCELLHTPWEVKLPAKQAKAFADFAAQHFDTDQAEALKQAFSQHNV
jgi:predicted O-methyltransferase YrrM